MCYPLTPNSASSKLDPNYARAFANRGIAYGRKREYDRAIQDFDQAIRLDPDLALAFYGRGIAHYDKREFDQAIQDYRQAIRLFPNYALAFYGCGTAYHEKRQHNRAIRLTLSVGQPNPDANRILATAVMSSPQSHPVGDGR